MADEKDFKYDPEAEEDTAKYRLPFALCKHYGIAIQDWWTPRDAWNALKKNGNVDQVSEKYKEYYRNKKKELNKDSRNKTKAKREQLKDPKHNPDKNYRHIDGAIAGVKKSKPMTFEEADSGNVNPFINKGRVVGDSFQMYRGYRHNCQTCVATYFARRQGYDVRALPNLDNESIYKLSYNTSLAYIDKRGNMPKKENKPKSLNVATWLEATVEKNEIHLLEWTWKGKNKGHIVVVERNQEGELKIYDPQVNRFYDPKKDLYNCKDFQKTNLTGFKINEKFCDKIMKGR